MVNIPDPDFSKRWSDADYEEYWRQVRKFYEDNPYIEEQYNRSMEGLARFLEDLVEDVKKPRESK